LEQFEIFMLIFALLSTVFAATHGLTNSFFVGVQSGFSHNKIKRTSKTSATDLGIFWGNRLLKICRSLQAPDLSISDNNLQKFKNLSTLENGTFNIKVDLSSLSTANPEDVKKAIGIVEDAIKTAIKTTHNISKIETILLRIFKQGNNDWNTALSQSICSKYTLLKPEDLSKIIEEYAKTECTANNGFVGLHLGFLCPTKTNLSLGVVGEAGTMFGSKLKNETNTMPDCKARFTASTHIRALADLTTAVRAGFDFGVAFNEVKPTGGGTSKWFVAPSARFVVSLKIKENIMATAFVGKIFPMTKPDWDDTFKAKYKSVSGGVGVSYFPGR
jgi:hypothetical protein